MKMSPNPKLLDPLQYSLPVNLDGFREAADGDESERIDLLKMYAAQLKQKLPQAQAAFEKNEFPQVARILHPLTGATFTCGLEEFGLALRSLEESTKVNDAPATLAKFPHVIDYARRIDAAIARELV